MAAFIVRRALTSVVILLGISVLLFVLLRMMPGDPAAMMLDPVHFQGDWDAALARMHQRLGLDQPVWVQYFRWLLEVLQGNLGYSYADGRSVTSLLSVRLGATVRLVGVALAIALAVGVLLGVIAALRQKTAVDYVISFATLLMISVPAFFIALIAIFVFSLTLGWLPTGGMATSGGSGSVGDALRHLVMPAGILGLMYAGPYARYARSSMLEVLGQDYMTTARSKGLSRLRIVLRHGLHNALVPLVTVVAVQIPVMLGGAVILEQVFSWPGMGRLAIDAIFARDYPILLGFVMVVAILVLLCNLVADVLYAVIDPRIRL